MKCQQNGKLLSLCRSWRFYCSMIAHSLFGFTAGLIYLDLLTCRPAQMFLWKFFPYICYTFAIEKEQEELFQHRHFLGAAMWNFMSASSVLALSIISGRFYAKLMLAPVFAMSTIQLFHHCLAGLK